MDRKGTVLGEGAIVLALCSERVIDNLAINPMASIMGYGFSNDYTHIAHTRSESMHNAMSMAINKSKVDPLEIDYGASHGTGTLVNDQNALDAIHDLWSEEGKARERVGEFIQRVGLGNFLDAIGLDPVPQMVAHPRENPYVFYEEYYEEGDEEEEEGEEK